MDTGATQSWSDFGQNLIEIGWNYSRHDRDADNQNQVEFRSKFDKNSLVSVVSRGPSEWTTVGFRP